jgi:hypothetical protein
MEKKTRLSGCLSAVFHGIGITWQWLFDNLDNGIKKIDVEN